jgi:hypothetical protein
MTAGHRLVTCGYMPSSRVSEGPSCDRSCDISDDRPEPDIYHLLTGVIAQNLSRMAQTHSLTHLYPPPSTRPPSGPSI